MARHPFRRSSVRYGDTPAPVTPYQRAAQVWDEREGGKRREVRAWRLAFGGVLCVLAVTAFDNARRRFSSAVVPWIVHADDAGHASVVGPADGSYVPTDAQIAGQLGTFIKSVCALSSDPVVVRENWLGAYDMVTDRGAQALNALARERDPFGKVGRETVSLKLKSIVRASDRSFRIAWSEQHVVDGTAAPDENWTAIVTVVLQLPRDLDKLKRNPLGIYVHAVNWTKEAG